MQWRISRLTAHQVVIQTRTPQVLWASPFCAALIWFPVSGSPRSHSELQCFWESRLPPQTPRCRQAQETSRMREWTSFVQYFWVSCYFYSEGKTWEVPHPYQQARRLADAVGHCLGRLIHTSSPKGKRGTYLVLPREPFIDPPPGDFWPKSPSLCSLE